MYVACRAVASRAEAPSLNRAVASRAEAPSLNQVLPGLSSEQRKRCLTLVSGDSPPAPTDRNGALLCVAHAAIWKANGVVYGGFVRDYICGGREASDVDVNVSDPRAAAAVIVDAVAAFGISGKGGDPTRSLQTWGAAQRLTLSFRGQPIEVDLVDPATVPRTPPGVDCSANNLQIGRSGLALKVALEAVVSLEMCVQHAQYKKMIFFYEQSADGYRRRLQKMQGKGFTLVPWEGPPLSAAGLPCSWTSERGLFEVARNSAEFEFATARLVATLGRAPQIHRVRRVQNAKVFCSFQAGDGVTLMFHGCKSQANEDAIVQHGFDIKCCVSRQHGYATFFAYHAQYSDGSYALTDSEGWKHLFVCLVSKHQDDRRDDSTMRVVGQDCAYPQWVVHYR